MSLPSRLPNCLCVLLLVVHGHAVAGDDPVIQGFPAADYKQGDFDPAKPDLASGGLDSAWVIDWDVPPEPPTPGGDARVLRIERATYYWREGKATRGMVVLDNLEVAEIFVAYDRREVGLGDYFDIALAYNFGLKKMLDSYKGPSCVVTASILADGQPHRNERVLKEIHDDGIRWMNEQGRVRRGEKLTLTSILDAENYWDVIEFGFSDDGTVTPRVGVTGINRSGSFQNKFVHTHLACWRFDPVLKAPSDPEPVRGAGDVTLRVICRKALDPIPPDPDPFELLSKPYNPDGAGVAREGPLVCVPGEFTRLRFQSNRVANTHCRATCYDLIPMRSGVSGSFIDDDYRAANADCWVTHTGREETNVLNFSGLPRLLPPAGPLGDEPFTVWHSATLLHEPRTEDFGGPDGDEHDKGAALTAWAGCILRPRDLFDGTPFFAPGPPPDGVPE